MRLYTLRYSSIAASQKTTLNLMVKAIYSLGGIQ